MFWPFKKKIPEWKPQPKRVEILPEHQMELRQLWDAYKNTAGSDIAACYAFWSRAAALYPAITTACYRIVWDACTAEFVEPL